MGAKAFAYVHKHVHHEVSKPRGRNTINDQGICSSVVLSLGLILAPELSSRQIKRKLSGSQFPLSHRKSQPREKWSVPCTHNKNVFLTCNFTWDREHLSWAITQQRSEETGSGVSVLWGLHKRWRLYVKMQWNECAKRQKVTIQSDNTLPLRRQQVELGKEFLKPSSWSTCSLNQVFNWSQCRGLGDRHSVLVPHSKFCCFRESCD